MIRLAALIARLPDVAEVEVMQWVARGWVRPAPWPPEVAPPPEPVFQEIDVARCRLIVELRRDIGVPEDVLPVVLDLLDQVHDLRRTLRLLAGAVDRLPPSARDAVLRELGHTATPADLPPRDAPSGR